MERMRAGSDEQSLVDRDSEQAWRQPKVRVKFGIDEGETYKYSNQPWQI